MLSSKISTESDEEIVLAYKNDSQEAFKKLMERYISPLYNFVARLTNRNDAPDIVQEIFIKVWKHINSFDENKASFKTWIFTIAKNTTTDFLRKKRSILFSDLEKDNEEDAVSFAENIPAEEILQDEILQNLQEKTANDEFLNNLLNNIKPVYREVLLLHYQEEMTFEEIGKILNKPLNTIKSQHRRAIIEMKKMIN